MFPHNDHNHLYYDHDINDTNYKYDPDHLYANDEHDADHDDHSDFDDVDNGAVTDASQSGTSGLIGPPSATKASFSKTCGSM